MFYVLSKQLDMDHINSYQVGTDLYVRCSRRVYYRLKEHITIEKVEDIEHDQHVDSAVLGETSEQFLYLCRQKFFTRSI